MLFCQTRFHQVHPSGVGLLPLPPKYVAQLPVHQASALPSASSRFAVTRDTPAVKLTLPLAG